MTHAQINRIIEQTESELRSLSLVELVELNHALLNCPASWYKSACIAELEWRFQMVEDINESHVVGECFIDLFSELSQKTLDGYYLMMRRLYL